MHLSFRADAQRSHEKNGNDEEGEKSEGECNTGTLTGRSMSCNVTLLVTRLVGRSRDGRTMRRAGRRRGGRGGRGGEVNERLLCSDQFHLATLIEEAVLWLPELFFCCEACNHNASHRNYLLLRSCLVRLRKPARLRDGAKSD